MTTQTRLTCTCGSRYVRDAEHEGDCDLWLIDEFWAGFLAWDWDRECLVPTPKNPDYHRGTLDEEYIWDNDSPVQQRLREMDEGRLAPNGQTVEDVMLTTDAFIDRMLSNSAAGIEDDGAWQKDANGMWVKTEKYPNGSTSKTYSATLPSDGYDSYDWSTAWATDRHSQTPVHMPDGETTVYCTSLSKQYESSVIPDFGLYLDGGWRPDGMAIMLPWQDYGLPKVSDTFADYAIKEAFAWASAGAFVEVGCIGAHGRTGVVVACMAILADPELTGEEAVAFVRTAYCQHAIESKEQEWWVTRFHAEHHGLPVPTKPVWKPAPTVVSTTSTTGTGGDSPKSGGATTGSLSAGPVGDPNRKGKARRSKRGGRRQQRHRNRMASR